MKNDLQFWDLQVPITRKKKRETQIGGFGMPYLDVWDGNGWYHSEKKHKKG